MKMSDVFPLPLDPTIPAGETLAFDTTGEAAEAAVHAVNHHDALVEALDNLVKGRSTCCPDSYYLRIRTAAALLEQIKNDK